MHLLMKSEASATQKQVSGLVPGTRSPLLLEEFSSLLHRFAISLTLSFQDPVTRLRRELRRRITLVPFSALSLFPLSSFLKGDKKHLN